MMNCFAIAQQPVVTIAISATSTRPMAFLITFDGIPGHTISDFSDHVIDRTYLDIECTLPSGIKRHVDLECSGTGRWGAKCFEEFADKTKPMRKWSCPRKTTRTSMPHALPYSRPWDSMISKTFQSACFGRGFVTRMRVLENFFCLK